MKNRAALIACMTVLATSMSLPAVEIGFVEDFALASNRTAVLNQLIPGTEEFYYYTCLNYQNLGQFDKVEETLKLWLKRYGETEKNWEIRNRQALLTYSKNPKASLDHISRMLGLFFNHQQEIMGRKTSFQTSLDQNVISRDALAARAFAEGENTLSQFTASANDFLAAMKLSGDHRRDLLRRLNHPAYPSLVQLVAEDLNYEHAQPFGSYTVHKQMLLQQLDALLALRPNLLNEHNFVNIYLTKLQPGPDVDWQHDVAQREAFLNLQWAFVSRLSPIHNSLKLHILYQRLEHDRALGKYDKDRFMEYIRIPRWASYVNPKYLERADTQGLQAQFGMDFKAYTLMPTVQTDEKLVRDCLEHFFIKEDDYVPYQAFLLETYLREVMAETKILNGIGDMEKWYSLLNDPGKYQALKDRIEIEFSPANATFFQPGEKVALDVDIKNVRTLIVKVFEINTYNYYRDKLKPVDTAVDLDGLVAGKEQVISYEDQPLRRVRRHFDFPELSGRGVYVVEFIGNGKSSRALIQKGSWRYLERVGAAGHVFTILDEQNRKIDNGSLWLAGHDYKADAKGQITVPFSTNPGTQPILISAEGFTSLDEFDHKSETYNLTAGIYVDRESLLAGANAKAIIRPQLTVNGVPIALRLLEEPVLMIESVDAEGVKTTKEAKDFQLSSEQETVYEFAVPQDSRSIGFVLKGKIRNLSQNVDVELSDSRSFELNQMDATQSIAAMHLSRTAGGYILRVLGKNGEPKADRPVNISLKHKDFVRPAYVTLQTDADGIIKLGALEGIDLIVATGQDNQSRTWTLSKDVCLRASIVHARAGEKINVPYMGVASKPDNATMALLEMTANGTYSKDWFAALEVKDGFVVVSGLPAGSFELWLKESNEKISVQVTGGEVRNGYIMGANRLLEEKNPAPLQMEKPRIEADKLTIVLRNASPLTRVHVAAARFMPVYSIFNSLLVNVPPEPVAIQPGYATSLYVSGRDIGDEYRYILERKYAEKFPGNLLARPGLLLNPWALRTTDIGFETLAGQGVYGSKSSGGRGRALSRFAGGMASMAAGDSALLPNLDFLKQQAVVLANLKPDADGKVTIAMKDIGAGRQIHVLAVNPNNVVYREVALPDAPLATRDLRLENALDANSHFTERKQISPLLADGKLVIQDLRSSKFELYDSLRRVHSLYVTLSGDPTLQEFGFINDWPKLKPEEKREKYSKYACHELNFFLFKKDRAFFDKVIQPYLRNKKDKTFLDHWLIGDDVSSYLKPWAYGQLNIVERILLAQRIKGEDSAAAKHLKDLQDMIPPDLNMLDQLFMTAIKGNALEAASDAEGYLGLDHESRKEVSGTLSLAPRSPLVMKGLVNGRAAGGGKAKKDAYKLAAASAPEEMVAEVDDMPVVADMAAEKEEGEELAAASDVRTREEVRQLYRKLDQTKEWAENNYYHLPIAQQNASLVAVNPFWLDYAKQGKGPFLSTHFAEASRNFTEMMFALSVLDLPFVATESKPTLDGEKLEVKAGNELIAFHKEIKPSEPAKDGPPVLISQNYFVAADRYKFENGERFDKFVTDEFLSQTLYGCQVVLTDPSSSPQKLDVLLQIPKGAIPVQNGFYTRSKPVQLQPFSTLTMEYYFYFPLPGEYSHFPAHAAKEEKVIASAPGKVMKVVETPSKIDTTSWDYVSQNGSADDVIAFLNNDNPVRLNLEKIAWRMREKDFFNKVTGLLAARHVYNHVIWSYGVYNNVPAAIREYLQHADDFLSRCGRYIDCELVTIDPVVRKTYQHLEYSPLVNARTHQIGKRRQIFNQPLAAQYQELLKVLTYKPSLDGEDRLAVTYYMLLQDRISEAMGFLESVDVAKLTEKVQYDYMRAYVDFFSPAHKNARKIAEGYKDYPVDRWRNLFAVVLSQLDELDGKASLVSDKDSREQQQAKLADTEEALDFTIESRRITVSSRNVKQAVVNYYKMDIELLFSRNPFVEQDVKQFAYVQPNRSDLVKLPESGKPLVFELPGEFQNANVMVEIAAGGLKRNQPYFANSLSLQLIENYGQLKVTDQKTDTPLSGVYVKVFARYGNGEVKFYKDGYTDLRGQFDYASISTSESGRPEKYALLVMSEKDGAVVREAVPPKE